jgi:hypothetical protein
MRMERISVGVIALAIATAFAGCGGDDSKKSSAAADKPAAAAKPAVTSVAAKIAARTGVTVVEACYTDTADYSQCQTAAALGQYDEQIKWGTEPGQVQVADASASTYTVQSDSSDGVSFKVEKGEDGTLTRSCTDGDGCNAGAW